MAQVAWGDLLALVQRHGAGVGADLVACAAAEAESGRDPAAVGDNGHSYGLWQMYDQGLGAGMTPAERADPDTAAAVMVPVFTAMYQAGITAGYSGEELVRYCAMYTERPAGFPDLHSAAADRYVIAWHTAAAALGGDAPPYNPDQPAELQVQSWACSIRTATWMLKSIGGTLDAGAVQDRMVAAGLVSPADGLEDGSGASLADFLAAQSGLPTGHQFPVTWDDLQALPIGQQPFGLGGEAWDHWVGVRRWAFGMLELANPAPGWMGIRNELAEADFDRLGPFAAVWIELSAGGDNLSAEERAELGQLRSTVSSYVNDTFTPLAATMDALLAKPPSKAALLSTITEMRNSIRTNVGV